jgi:hypothetical protein
LLYNGDTYGTDRNHIPMCGFLFLGVTASITPIAVESAADKTLGEVVDVDIA